MFETREIEAFLAVAAELHFGRAAERLHLSTSRVSQSVRALERRVGGPVFERTSRSVRLTPLGEQLLAGLGPAYERLGQILAEARRAAGDRTLMVGFSGSMPPEVQRVLTEAFESARPGNQVVAVPVNPMDMFLWDARIGVGLDAFVGWLPPGTGRTVSPVLTAGPVIRYSPPALLMSPDHPFARRDSVGIEELAGHRVLAIQGLERLSAPWVPPVTPSGRAIETVRHDVRYLEALPALVAHADIVHLTIQDLAAAFPTPGLALVPLTGRAPFECRTVWATSRETAAVREFARVAARAGAAAGWLASGEAG